MIETMRPAAAMRGVSLIEALVALAVMAFGILGMVGIQATLRVNGEVSKQRSEAVRLAQQKLEQARGYTTLTTTAGQVAYQDIISSGPDSITNSAYNTTFKLQTTVSNAPVGNAKIVQASVAWSDRTSSGSQTNQSVALNTVIAGVAPELAGSLSSPINASATRRLSGRNVNIPVGAVDQGNGTSTFSPPGASNGLSWVFNNVTGLITSTCTTSGGITTCTAANSFYVAGYVRYSLDKQPSPQDGENPTSIPFLVNVQVNLTAPPKSKGTTDCYEQVPTGTVYLAYYCAVPLDKTDPQKWSGTVYLVFSGGYKLAQDANDDKDNHYRVCRYAPTASPTRNVDHPAAYTNVDGPLANQNFLVITAGNDSGKVYTCPADDPSTPVNTSTFAYQP